MFILDSDHLTILGQPDSPARLRMVAQLAQQPPEDVVTTVITYEEQTRGWFAFLARAKTVSQELGAYDRLLRHLDTFREIPVLPYDQAAADHFQKLRAMRIRVGTMDLKIAAISLSRNSTLLRRNLSDFKQVPGLQCEDWTR